MTIEKITDAILTIKKVCLTHSNCANCPLRDKYNGCSISQSDWIVPCSWKVTDEDFVELKKLNKEI